jgi:hypothetical protein
LNLYLLTDQNTFLRMNYNNLTRLVTSEDSASNTRIRSTTPRAVIWQIYTINTSYSGKTIEN